MKKVGMIKGRHDLPVDSYILDEVPDVMDFEKIKSQIFHWFDKNVKTGIADFGTCLNQADALDVRHFRSEALVVYVTGLTTAVAIVIEIAAMIGSPLTLMHFNKETQEYVPQFIFR